MRDRVLAVLTRAVGGGALLLFFAIFGFTPGPSILDLRLPAGAALLLDALLSLAFFLQHSLMVRAPVRAQLSRLVPAHALGAAYSIASGAVLGAVVLLWQRVEPRLAGVEGPARWIGPAAAALALGAFAWAAASLRPFDPFGARAIERHLRGAPVTPAALSLVAFVWGGLSLRGFDPFGARAVEKHLRGEPPRPSSLSVRGPYRWVRHPLYLCTLVLIWSCPAPTADRLLFDVLWTGWILVGTALEERDLSAELGQPYRTYQRRVPMLVPWRRPVEPTG